MCQLLVGRRDVDVFYENFCASPVLQKTRNFKEFLRIQNLQRATSFAKCVSSAIRQCFQGQNSRWKWVGGEKQGLDTHRIWGSSSQFDDF